MEVGIHGGVGGPVSENDGVAGESDGESGEDGGVGWLERVIPLCPYVPNSSFELFLGGGAKDAYTQYKQHMLKEYQFVQLGETALIGAAKLALDALGLKC